MLATLNFRHREAMTVLDGPIAMMRQYLGAAETHRPGGQHEVDQRYLHRIEALNFAIAHDDGSDSPTPMIFSATMYAGSLDLAGISPACSIPRVSAVRL